MAGMDQWAAEGGIKGLGPHVSMLPTHKIGGVRHFPRQRSDV